MTMRCSVVLGGTSHYLCQVVRQLNKGWCCAPGDWAHLVPPKGRLQGQTCC